MQLYTGKTAICTADYLGPDRRRCCERRVALDPRHIARFDLKGGDRRSGFARRSTDQGYH